jgi:hypothetical protein
MAPAGAGQQGAHFFAQLLVVFPQGAVSRRFFGAE